MMSKVNWSHANAITNYISEFKSEAIKNVIDKGHSVADLAKRLGIPLSVFCDWLQGSGHHGPCSSLFQSLGCC